MNGGGPLGGKVCEMVTARLSSEEQARLSVLRSMGSSAHPGEDGLNHTGAWELGNSFQLRERAKKPLHPVSGSVASGSEIHTRPQNTRSDN